MRLAHTLSFLALAACAAAPTGAQQPLPAPAAAPAADPSAAVPPLQHPPLPASGGVETAQTGWHAAHEAVAAFPRGHADIAAWEAAQARKQATPAPAAGHLTHGGRP